MPIHRHCHVKATHPCKLSLTREWSQPTVWSVAPSRGRGVVGSRCEALGRKCLTPQQLLFSKQPTSKISDSGQMSCEKQDGWTNDYSLPVLSATPKNLAPTTCRFTSWVHAQAETDGWANKRNGLHVCVLSALNYPQAVISARLRRRCKHASRSWPASQPARVQPHRQTGSLQATVVYTPA